MELHLELARAPGATLGAQIERALRDAIRGGRLVGIDHVSPVASAQVKSCVLLAGLAADGPTSAEMARSLAQTEAQFVYRLQTVGGFGGKSDQLNAYNVFRGDPGYFTADRARYESATPASVAEGVRRYLVDAPHVALSVVPRGATALALPDSTPVEVQ
ncbi:MAG: hypothetical protein ACLGHP_07870 [Vicinamibacteria bacterium]